MNFFPEFDQVLEATHHVVRAYLASLGVPLHCVDDLAQEVYLVWFRAPERRPEEVLPVRWLKGIAHRLALIFFRVNQRRELRELAVAAKLLATEPLALPMAADDSAERALESCLGEMPEKSRAMLRLRYEEKLDSGSIGRQLGMTAEAVRIFLMRVRGALRDCITARLEGGAP